MRNLLLTALVLILVISARAEDYEIIQNDSLIIGRLAVSKPGKAEVPIEFVNTTQLGALQIPVHLLGEGAKIDSVSFTGSRLAYIRMLPVTVSDKGRQVLFGAITMMEDYIQPGRGLMATLHLTITDSLKNNSIIIDTTTIKPASLLFTRSNSTCYVPTFVAGSIYNPDAASTRAIESRDSE